MDKWYCKNCGKQVSWTGSSGPKPTEYGKCPDMGTGNHIWANHQARPKSEKWQCVKCGKQTTWTGPSGPGQDDYGKCQGTESKYHVWS